MDVSSSAFLVALLQIIGLNIILSGDNALVIALACRSIPMEQRKWGILLGTGAAMALRIIFAVIIVYLLEVPLLKFIGSLLLIWIAVKLVVPEDSEGEQGGYEATSLWHAVKIVAIADVVMSLDNVLSIAAAAKGSVLLLSLGIAISMPLMAVGSAMMLWVLDRFPLLAVAGAGLLGWIAGELAVYDHIAGSWIAAHASWLPAVLPGILCAAVMAIGIVLRRRRTARLAEAKHTEGDHARAPQGHDTAEEQLDLT